MILAFAHPCLVVPDAQAAVDFYSKMFGFTVVTSEGWNHNRDIDRAIGLNDSHCTGFTLAGHNCFLEIFQFESTKSQPTETKTADSLGIRHLAFYVDDVVLESERFLALGGTLVGEPNPLAVYLSDPFGNLIELCTIPTDKENPLELPGLKCLNLNHKDSPCSA